MEEGTEQSRILAAKTYSAIVSSLQARLDSARRGAIGSAVALSVVVGATATSWWALLAAPCAAIMCWQAYKVGVWVFALSQLERLEKSEKLSEEVKGSFH